MEKKTGKLPSGNHHADQNDGHKAQGTAAHLGPMITQAFREIFGREPLHKTFTASPSSSVTELSLLKVGRLSQLEVGSLSSATILSIPRFHGLHSWMHEAKRAAKALFFLIVGGLFFDQPRQPESSGRDAPGRRLVPER